MAKTRFIQTNFTSGVLSPLLRGRIELEQYYNGLEVGENVVLLPQGGVKRRPGTKHIEHVLPVLNQISGTLTTPNGGTPTNLTDDDKATESTTTTPVGTTNPFVVAQYDFGSIQEIEVVDLQRIRLSLSDTSNEFVIQSSDDAVIWSNAASVPLIGVSPQDFRLRLNVSARYLRLTRIGSTDLGANNVVMSDFIAWEKSSTLSMVKFKDFSVTTDRHYLFVLTDNNCRIYRSSDDAYVADVRTPFLSGDLANIRDVQTESVILLFQEDYETVRIINLGTDSGWFQDKVPYINVPETDFNDELSPTPVDEIQTITFNGFTTGQQFQIDVEGILSKNITFAGVTTADEQSATAENIRKNLQDMPNFSDTGVSVVFAGGTSFTITISDSSADDFELFSGFPTTGAAADNITFAKVQTGSPRKEPVWSATRGWPKTACYYEGRLIIGGTKSRPQSLFASKAGLAFNFEIDESDDDDAVFATISARELSTIVDVFPGRNLQIFTAGAEFAVLQSPITPQTFGVIPQTSHGSFNLEAKEIDGATLIIDRNGKTLREFLYNFNEDAYVANDISVLSPELISQPKDLAILGGSQSDDANWVFIVNSDGSATVLNTLRSQDINGFTKWTTSGELEDVSVVDDQLYMANRRTINGSEVIHVEKWDFDFFLDDAIEFTYGSPTSVITGLDHLEGETVKVRADQAFAGEFIVTGGQITLGNPKTVVQVGIPYTPFVRSMPVSTNIGSGPNVNRIRKVIRVNANVLDAQGIYIDGQPVPVKQFAEASASPLDTPPIFTTGIIADFMPSNGFGRDVMPTLSQPDPMPFTILNIEYEVESS